MISLLQSVSRPRSLLVLLAAVAGSLYLLHATGSQTTASSGYVPPTTILPSYDSDANIPLCIPAQVDDFDIVPAQNSAADSPVHSIPIEGVKAYMQSHISSLQQGFNATADDEFLGLKLYNTIHLPDYTAELLETYETYLAMPHIATPSFLPLVKSRLSLSPPIAPLAPRPNIITTTDAHRDLVPSEFAHWERIMPHWKTRVFEDKDMEDWVADTFGGTEAEKVWKRLPRMVLKTDILRYLLLLVEGGIYSDSDTAPIIDADLWGYPYDNATDPLLSHLSRIISLSNTGYRAVNRLDDSLAGDLSSDEDDYSEEMLDNRSKLAESELRIGPGMIPLVEDGSELGKPSLIVSVESDAIEFGWTNWREVGLSRADQIVQWTIMARPGHPVFLDAIGHSLKKSIQMEQLEAEAQAEGRVFMPESALEWTGPGIFTDSVMRYLLTRYGFQPRQLLHVKNPTRVGDVLILPAGSYSSVSPFTGETQRKWAASFHGFFGRWRDSDPQIQEQERLKKIKEEEEKANEALKDEQIAEGRIDSEEINFSENDNLDI